MMIRLPPPLAILSAIAIALPLLPVHAFPSISSIPSISSRLLSRQAPMTCSVQCPSSLPTDFCCPASTVCQSLAGDSTALCCPTGFDCSLIQPITCNLTLQDMTADPNAVIMTSALTGTLTTCGVNCCPFGYNCNAMQQCVRNTDQTAWPPGGSNTTNLGDIPGSEAANNGIATAVGVLAGIASAIALIAGGVLYWRHKRASVAGRAAFNAATRSDTISGPMGGGGPTRHDFIHKRLNRVTSLFRRNSMGMAEPVQSGFAPDGDDDYENDEEMMNEKNGGGPARKQSASPYRPYNGGSQSGASGAPGDFDPYDRRFTNATNFSDMMDEADLGPVHRGQETYVPPVPQMPPQSAWNKLLRR